MVVKVRERVAGPEIHVVVHGRELIPGNERAWWTRVRNSSCRSRKRGRPRRRGQRDYAFCGHRFAASRGVAGSCVLLRVRSGVRGIVARSAVLLLRAQRQSQKRAHHQCCTPVAHLHPPELHPLKPVWFTRPPAGRLLPLAGFVRRIAAFPLSLFPLQAPTSLHTRTHGETCRSKRTRRSKVIPQFAFRATISSLPGPSRLSFALVSNARFQLSR